MSQPTGPNLNLMAGPKECCWLVAVGKLQRPKIAERLETQPDRRAGKPVEPVLIAEPHARGVVEHPFPDRVQPDHEVLAPFFQKELPLDFVPMLVLPSWEGVLDVQGDRGPGIPLV